MVDPRIRDLRQHLTCRTRSPVPVPVGALRASVALLVRPGAEDLELLLIKRTIRPGDPWSGHMALPGGRREPGDADDVETVVRETREEVEIDLDAVGVALGALDVAAPRSGAPPVTVSPYVFAVPAGTRAAASPEVELAMWVPVGELLRPGAAVEYLHRIDDGRELRFPAFGYQGHMIWGLTHRILSQFLEIAASTLSIHECS